MNDEEQGAPWQGAAGDGEDHALYNTAREMWDNGQRYEHAPVRVDMILDLLDNREEWERLTGGGKPLSEMAYSLEVHRRINDEARWTVSMLPVDTPKRCPPYYAAALDADELEELSRWFERVSKRHNLPHMVPPRGRSE